MYAFFSSSVQLDTEYFCSDCDFRTEYVRENESENTNFVHIVTTDF